MSVRDDDGLATVPPPAGEADAYNAETRVGDLPPELMAELATYRQELAKPSSVAPESRPKPAPPAPRRPPPPMQGRPVVSASVSAPALAPSHVDPLAHEVDVTSFDVEPEPPAAGPAIDNPFSFTAQAPSPAFVPMPLGPLLTATETEAVRASRQGRLRVLLVVLGLVAVLVVVGLLVMRSMHAHR